jgi:hypothetical protein
MAFCGRKFALLELGLLIASCLAGQTRYAVSEPCFPVACANPVAINDAGAFITRGNQIYEPGVGLRQIINSPVPAVVSEDINNAGEVVGYIAGFPYIAFLQTPGSPSYIDLTSLFHYPQFPRLIEPFLSINDRGDIAASSNVDRYPGLNGTVVRINNSGQVLATDGLFTPGRGVTALEGFGLWLNNRGQVLLNLAGGSFVLTIPGQTDIAMPPGFHPSRVNDGGDVIGSVTAGGSATTVPMVFRSSTGELINLNDALDAAGWQLAIAWAINNRGQIAVSAFPAQPRPEYAFGTTVILTPQ